MKAHLILVLGIAVAMSVTSARADGVKSAVFDCQLADLAQLTPTEADKSRLPHVSDLLRQKLQESGKFDIVPITPKVRMEVKKSSDLRSCGGCAIDFAKQLDAQLAVTCQIQKVSDLILEINVYMKEVDTDKLETATSVDIRGDNDVSFDRGIKYLLKDNILKQ